MRFGSLIGAMWRLSYFRMYHNRRNHTHESIRVKDGGNARLYSIEHPKFILFGVTHLIPDTGKYHSPIQLATGQVAAHLTLQMDRRCLPYSPVETYIKV